MVKFYDLINANYYREQKISFYCDKLNIEHSKLSQITTSLLGVTPKVLLNQKIIVEAKILLAYSDLSMKQICYEIGLNEPSYFTKFFKKHEGCSPITFLEK